jgi:hypothetical protein
VSDKPRMIAGNHPAFDRPELFLTNLLSGEWSAAGRAVYDPASLTPEERKTLAERWGVAGTPLEGAIDITTNPLVLAGLMFSFAFPAIPAAAWSTMRTAVSSFKTKFPWTRFVSPVSEVYRDTDVPDLLQKIHRRRMDVGSEIANEWEDILTEYTKSTGRKTISRSDQTVVAAMMDGLDNPNHQVWYNARRKLHDMKASAPEEISRHLRALEDPLAAVRSKLANADPALKRVADRTSQLLQKTWDKWLEDPKNRERILEALGRKHGYNGRASLEDAKRLNRYFPHIKWATPEERILDIEASLKSMYSGAPRSEYVERATRHGMELAQSTERLAPRAGAMMPHPEDLKLLGVSDDVIEAVTYQNKRAMAELRASATTASEAAEKAKQAKMYSVTAMSDDGVPLYYTLRSQKAIHDYTSDLSRAVAFNLPDDITDSAAPSMGQLLRNAVETQVAPVDAWSAKVLEETVIPQVAGAMSVTQANRSLWWASVKNSALKWLDQPTVKKVVETASPKGFHQQLKNWLLWDPHSNVESLSGDAAGWLYTSTLGLPNPVPAALNLLQPISTALPLGPQYMIRGYAQATKEMLNYAKLRLQGIPSHKALKQAMPTFAKTHLELDPISSEVIRDNLDNVIDRAFGSGGRVKQLSRTMQSRLLSLFSGSELFNRLSVFNAMYQKGLRELPGQSVRDATKGILKKLPLSSKSKAVRQAAEKFAMDMTYMTQFGGGPLQRPMGTLNWPSLMSQFTTFPLRMAGLVAGPMMRNPRYLGGAMTTAGMAYEVGQMVNADLSRGLLFGGLPEPSGFGPFPTLPVVPPALQLAGGGVMSLATGESEHFRRSLPLLVPGGVGLARALPNAPVVGEFAGQLVEKDYAQWGNRTPEGLIPVHKATGQLKGYYTPGQLAGKALGLGDMQGQRESQLTQYLLSQRDQIREFRRRYLEAVAQNDPRHALRIRQEYDRRYPGMGGLPVDSSDIKTLHMRENVTRIERILETMPPELRDQYQAVIASVMGAQFDQFLGLYPGGLDAGSTIHLREPYRRNPKRSVQQRLDKGLHGMHYREKLKREGIDVTGAGVGRGIYYQQEQFYTPSY